MRSRTDQGEKVRFLIVTYVHPSPNRIEDLPLDLSFFKGYSVVIEKMAVVEEHSWKTTWVALFGLFSGIETSYFPKPGSQQAMTWLVED